jgi:hypothetical protein
LDEIAFAFEPVQFELEKTVPPVIALLSPDRLPGKLRQPTPLFTMMLYCDPE